MSRHGVVSACARAVVVALIVVTAVVGFAPPAAAAEVEPGAAVAWGSGYPMVTADGMAVESAAPVAIYPDGALDGVTLTAVTSGNLHACGLASDGVAYCWGASGSGRLGTGVNTPEDQATSPAAVDTDDINEFRGWSAIDAGDISTCALTEGRPYCWGSRFAGALGDDSTSDYSPVPVAVHLPSGVQLRQISVGSMTTCGLATDGVAYCWGRGSEGQLGDGIFRDQVEPFGSEVPVLVDTTDLPEDVRFTSVSVGSQHVCAVGDDGRAYCWVKEPISAVSETAGVPTAPSR